MRSNGCWSAASATPATRTRVSAKSRRTKPSTPWRARRCWWPRKSPRSAAYRVLHALVDSLYVRKPGATRDDYEALDRGNRARTGLPLAIEAVYRYVVFLPSKQFEDVPVPNRFFRRRGRRRRSRCAASKCRRHDTPPLVARMQQEGARDSRRGARFRRLLPRSSKRPARFCAGYQESLADGSVAIEDLIVQQTADARAAATTEKPITPPSPRSNSSAAACACARADHRVHHHRRRNRVPERPCPRLCVVGRLARLRPLQICGAFAGRL